MNEQVSADAPRKKVWLVNNPHHHRSVDWALFHDGSIAQLKHLVEMLEVKNISYTRDGIRTICLTEDDWQALLAESKEVE